MKLRYYRSEACIRSIGDPPNGVLTMSLHGGMHFTIDPQFEPTKKGGVTLFEQGDQRVQGVHSVEDPEHLTTVSVEEVIDACDNSETGAQLWVVALLAMRGLSDVALKLHDPAMGSWDLEAFGRFMDDLAVRLHERRWLPAQVAHNR